MSRSITLPRLTKLALVARVAGAIPAAASPLLTFDERSITLPEQPVSFATLDADSDGDTDIAVVDQTPATGGGISTYRITVLLNDGDANFTPLPPFIVPPEAIELDAADINDDGNTDLLLTSVLDPLGGRVVPYINIGGGSFAIGSTRSVGESPRDTITADITGDGLTDLLVADNFLDAIQVYANDAADPGTFVPLSLPPVPLEPAAIAAGDFDGDTFLDLAVGSSRSIDNDALAFLPNDGNGVFFSAEGTAFPEPLTTLAAGDLDNDGDIDLFGAGRNGIPQVSPGEILLNNGFGDFFPAASTTFLPADDVKLADFDNDGSLDLARFVRGTSAADSVAFNTNDGSAVFSELARSFAVIGPGQIEIADFNNDGRPDAATILGPGSPGIAVYLNRTPGPSCLADPVVGAIPATPSDIAASDDGDLIFVATASAGIAVYDTTLTDRPVQIAQITSSESARLVAWDDMTQRLYSVWEATFTSDDFIRVHDLSNPREPQLLGEIEFFAAGFTDLATDGATLFVLSSSRLRTFDVADPTQPMFLDSRSDVGGQAFVLDGTIAYVAGIDAAVVDVSDPASLAVIAPLPASSSNSSPVAIAGDVLALNRGVIELYDVSDPSDPLFITAFDNPGNGSSGGPAFARDFAAIGTTIYATNGFNGFFSADISDPQNPIVNGFNRIRLQQGSPFDQSLLAIPSKRTVAVAITNASGSSGSTGTLAIYQAAACIAPPACPGDTDGDNTVTPLDISTVLSNFGLTNAAGPSEGDINSDSIVNALDISTVLDAFGSICN